MKSNIQINSQPSHLALAFSIHDPNDWNRFARWQYPDGSWQLRIKKEMFDTFATKVGFSYDIMRNGPNAKPYKLEIRNNVTGKSRVFHYLGLDTLLNEGHWTSNDESPRVDLFVRL